MKLDIQGNRTINLYVRLRSIAKIQHRFFENSRFLEQIFEKEDYFLEHYRTNKMIRTFWKQYRLQYRCHTTKLIHSM